MPFLLLQEWKLKELVFYILTCLLRKIKEQTNLSKNHKEKKKSLNMLMYWLQILNDVTHGTCLKCNV